MTCREATPLLGAWLDEELDPAVGTEIETHCNRCPACAAAAENLGRLSQAVMAAPYYPAPPSLRARFQPSMRRLRRPALWLGLAASLVIVVVAGRLASPDHLAQDAVQAHIRSLDNGRLVDIAASGHHSVTPWLAQQLDFALQVDDISGRNFDLRGGRLDQLAGHRVAALVYRRGAHVINVFVWPARQQPDQEPHGRNVGGFNVVNWRADGMNWWAVSDLNLDELEQLPLCPCFLPAHETLRG